MKALVFAPALLAFLGPAFAAPSYVATFHSIGLYWSPPGGSPGNAARVEFRAAGASAWRKGLDLWFDARNAEYRGSIVKGGISMERRAGSLGLIFLSVGRRLAQEPPQARRVRALRQRLRHG